MSIQQEAENFMLMALDIDLKTYTDSAGEWNYTKLSEETAHHLDRDEWLDDPDHWIWELSIKATEEHRK